MNKVSWEELRRKRDYPRLADAVMEIMMLRRENRLRGSKRSIGDVLWFAETARRLIEFYEREDLLVFVLGRG